MSRKVFISFLGTGDYKVVPYGYQDHMAIITKYVQIATYKFLCSEFTKSDKVLIFTTETAKEKNWEDNGHIDRNTNEKIVNKGLKTCFFDIGLPIDAIDIPEGKEESELWTIFQKVFDQLEDSDEIIFDITHSFRTIPMLNMVLINYAKLLKKVTVKGIHYGAFEIESDIKPIWDVTAFSELQDWTIAASGFVNYGIANGIKDLAHKEVLPLLRAKEKDNDIAQNIFQIAKSIETITDSLLTNRGNVITQGNVFLNFKTNLAKVSNVQLIPPFYPILRQVEKKLEEFNCEYDIMNGFKAVKWCIEHDLVQQGFTMLQESILTYYAAKCSFNINCEQDRKLISDAFYHINLKLEECNDDVAKVIPHISKEMASIYDSLAHSRNDINHGGFTRFASPTNLRTDLNTKFTKVMNLINNPHAPQSL